MTDRSDHAALGIWGYALGYFVCYAPYSALTKVISQGRLAGMPRGLTGFELLPSTTMASLIGMMIFLTWKGWWRHAGHRRILGVDVPFPGRWTFLSGLTAAAIIGTTTLAYTFAGVSIVFMMLLMRGGVLVIAPVVDAIARRKVQATSWIALGLTIAALFVAVVDHPSYQMTLVAIADVVIYLGAYFLRLRFMSHLAKSDDPRAAIRYFVEEQMVATPATVLALAIGALIGKGAILLELRRGFTDIASSGALSAAILVGLLSQGTGIFGGLILLDRRENTFCVPVNRASSVLAGVVASFGMTLLLGAPPPPAVELVGAGIVVLAVFVLAWPTLRARVAPAAPSASRA